jgi:hypothetical protein
MSHGRYLVVSGRRWRVTDPAIPEALRKELVDELMTARRLVRGRTVAPVPELIPRVDATPQSASYR